MKDLKDEILKRHMNFKEMASGLVLIRGIDFTFKFILQSIAVYFGDPLQAAFFLSGVFEYFNSTHSIDLIGKQKL